MPIIALAQRINGMVFVLPNTHCLPERFFLPCKQKFFANSIGDEAAPLALIDQTIEVGEKFIRNGASGSGHY